MERGVRGVDFGAGDARFAQGGDLGMWICGLEVWEAGFGAGLMQVWFGWVLRGDFGFHGLHRIWRG